MRFSHLHFFFSDFIACSSAILVFKQHSLFFAKSHFYSFYQRSFLSSFLLIFFTIFLSISFCFYDTFPHCAIYHWFCSLPCFILILMLFTSRNSLSIHKLLTLINSFLFLFALSALQIRKLGRYSHICI